LPDTKSAAPSNTSESSALAFTPIHELAERLRNGTLSASALIECYLERIHRNDKKLHAFIEVYADEARAAAHVADAAFKARQYRGPLKGIPIALKDLLEIEGRRTTAGSMFWHDRVSRVTSTAVEKLTAAGMIPLGKTHLVEFAFGSWGTNRTMGTPWNPWDLDVQRAPAGSSSGSGVAVGAALAPAAIGSDTGGSVRAPASLCGIVGLKTTIGRVSNYGVLMLSDTLDTLGPMTRDVEDAALLFMAMHGPDYRDAQTYAHPPSDVLSGLKSGIAGLRLAVLADEELGEIDSEVTHEFTAALDVLRGLGARIDTLKLPVSFDSMAVIVGKIIAAEGYALHREWIDRTDLPFDADVADRIRWAKNMSAADYVKIMGERKNLRQAIDVLLRDFDGLLLPTSPLPAPPLTAIDQGKAPMSRLTRPINLLDLCAVAIPCGYSAGGLPISMQIAARGYQEARVLRIAWAYENATEWHTRRPAGL